MFFFYFFYFYFFLIFWFVFYFLIFRIFFEIFRIFFLIFFGFFGFLSKLLRLQLKVTKVTTGHQKSQKMAKNSIISNFFAQRTKKDSAEGRSPLQELEVGPLSGPYLLVLDNSELLRSFSVSVCPTTIFLTNKFCCLRLSEGALFHPLPMQASSKGWSHYTTINWMAWGPSSFTRPFVDSFSNGILDKQD